MFEIRPEHAPGAFERGDHRKYIERRNCQKDRGSAGEQEKDLSGRTAGVCQKPEIEGSHDQSGAQGQPDQKRLDKILAEGGKKCFYREGVIALDRAEHAVIQRVQRGADGDQRDGAEQKQQIRNDHVSDLI